MARTNPLSRNPKRGAQYRGGDRMNVDHGCAYDKYDCDDDKADTADECTDNNYDECDTKRFNPCDNYGTMVRRTSTRSRRPIKVPPPLKSSFRFLTAQELFSYKAIPAVGVAAYLGSAVGATALRETFQEWFGSEFAAGRMHYALTFTSIFGISSYIYGRRHIRHAGAFEKILYPLFGSVFFNFASLLSWSIQKQVLRDQDIFDHHWRVVGGILSGLGFLYTGRSYLYFVDHW